MPTWIRRSSNEQKACIWCFVKWNTFTFALRDIYDNDLLLEIYTVYIFIIHFLNHIKNDDLT